MYVYEQFIQKNEMYYYKLHLQLLYGFFEVLLKFTFLHPVCYLNSNWGIVNSILNGAQPMERLRVCVCIIGKSPPVSQHAPWWRGAWQQASRVSRVAWQQHVSYGYDKRSPDDRKRHPSMSRWRVIPALGFAACEDSIHRSNQKSTAEGGWGRFITMNIVRRLPLAFLSGPCAPSLSSSE